MARRRGQKPEGYKTVKVPAFGRYLADCRERSREKPPNPQQIVTALKTEHGIEVNDATLRGYEYGWVDRPDPVVLWGLARVYRTDVEYLIAVLAANRKKRDLSDLELENVLREAAETTHGETGAAARLAEIQERLVDLVELSGAPTDARRQITEAREDSTQRHQGDRTHR